MVLRRSQRPHKAEATDLRGICVSGVAFRHDADKRPVPSPSLEELAEFWREHGDRLVAEHVATHPDTRPWAWWQFTRPALGLPEPRCTWHLVQRFGPGGLVAFNSGRPPDHEQRAYLEANHLIGR